MPLVVGDRLLDHAGRIASAQYCRLSIDRMDAINCPEGATAFSPGWHDATLGRRTKKIRADMDVGATTAGGDQPPSETRTDTAPYAILSA